MRWFDFGNRAAIEAFASGLAADLAKRYPPALELDASKKRNPTRLAKALDSAFNRAIAFQREHRLGLYGKAKLGNTFRWELKRLGYPEEFIDHATGALVTYITNVKIA
jgi:hypothetical protein